MIILGIETSCDETAAAIVEDGTKILASSVASSLELQKKYGGVVPEVASRKQAEFMIPVLKETFTKANLDPSGLCNEKHPAPIDAIAVTIGPGLLGSLLVGVETAKVLSYVWKIPLIPTNHLIGHIYSGWLDNSSPTPPQFPLLALIASGGHTDLVLMENYDQFKIIGSTKDDAVGEAFDKVARVLGLEYPGGPVIEKIARDGDPNAFNLPRPMINSNDLDFSYSGLKTAVLYKVKEIGPLNEQIIRDMAASFQQAAFEVLVEKTIRAATENNVRSLLVTGGVAANQRLKEMFTERQEQELNDITLHIPPLKLATDNATYIAAAAYFLHDKRALDPANPVGLDQILKLQPNPNMTAMDI